MKKKRLTQLRAHRVVMTRCRIFENRFYDGRVARTRPAAHDPKNPWVNTLQLHVFGRRLCVCGLATMENAERSNLSPSSHVKLRPLNKMTFGRGLFRGEKNGNDSRIRWEKISYVQSSFRGEKKKH